MKVFPQKTVINSGETTKVEKWFFRNNLSGKRIPLKGERVDLKVSGLIDGRIESQSDLITDENGTVVVSNIVGRATWLKVFTLNINRPVKLKRNDRELSGTKSYREPNMGTFAIAPHLIVLLTYCDPHLMEFDMGKSSAENPAINNIFPKLKEPYSRLKSDLRKKDRLPEAVRSV